MKTMKVGVIGVGGIAGTHMAGWDASPYTEVVAGADLNPTALEAWATKWNVSKTVGNADDLINDPDIDIIDICTPNAYHKPLTVAALEAGKHVLCEKPLAPTPDEIVAMIEAREKSGKMLMTAQHMRFSGMAKALKAEIDRGVLGNVYHARGWILRRIAIPARPGFLMKQHSSGGATIDIGVHILDLMLWLMGNPQPVSVTGIARTELAKIPGAFSYWDNHAPVSADKMDVEEMSVGFVRFENGATLIMEVSWMLHHPVPNNYYEDMQLWLYGNEGGAHFPKCEIYQTNYESRQLYDQKLLLTDNLAEPHAQECIEFAQAIVDGAASPVPAEQSLQVMQILDGIYTSQQTGREVLLNE